MSIKIMVFLKAPCQMENPDKKNYIAYYYIHMKF